jgi:acetyl esterase
MKRGRAPSTRTAWPGVEAMAARLSAAGVDVDLRVYPATPHGFTVHPTPMARAALDDIEA